MYLLQAAQFQSGFSFYNKLPLRASVLIKGAQMSSVEFYAPSANQENQLCFGA